MSYLTGEYMFHSTPIQIDWLDIMNAASFPTIIFDGPRSPHWQNDNNNDDDNIDNDDKNNNDTSDNDENEKNYDNDYKLPADSPHIWPIMLSLDVTFVESKNNSRVSGDLRCHVPYVTSPWCDTFTQHRHICIVESSYE